MLYNRRHGGLVVSALDFQSEGRWFRPGLCRHVVPYTRNVLIPLFQVFTSIPRTTMFVFAKFDGTDDV